MNTNDEAGSHPRGPRSGPHVVLLGVGYVSVWAYRALRRSLGDQVHITVVAPVDAHSYHGWTGEVLSGELPPEAQRSPIAEALPAAAHVRGWARRVDRDRRTVEVECADGATVTVTYDHLVVGIGSTEDVSSVPGLQEHGFRLRHLGQAGALAAHLDQCVAEAARSSYDRSTSLTVVVAGGGLAGVESSIAVSQRLAAATGAPTGSAGGPRVVLVSSRAELAQELREGGRELVRQALRRNGVEVLTGTRVVEVAADGVKLDDGLWIPAHTTLATVGNRVMPLPGLDDLPVDDRGRWIADRNLQVAQDVWAAGDAAVVPLKSGAPAPVDAGWAIGEGGWVGDNIARVIRGKQQKPFGFKSIGVAAGFGQRSGVLEAWGIAYRGRTAWFSRMLFFLYYMPSREQAKRVYRMLRAKSGD
ncbi:FAD-dependent oxidoreductase [Lentzea sp. NBRC 102530]|uniref:NAD(P)/FAD-dependent oxidoreductase n=1 Tax=Lentzea sp. NBRC 102530 TaxID=3032201 RepID=UPI00255773E6|nr:FAD-dependent oxidoreductase [Lentzea sp. NBRC 102530]